MYPNSEFGSVKYHCLKLCFYLLLTNFYKYHSLLKKNVKKKSFKHTFCKEHVILNLTNHNNFHIVMSALFFWNEPITKQCDSSMTSQNRVVFMTLRQGTYSKEGNLFQRRELIPKKGTYSKGVSSMTSQTQIG